MQVGILDSGVGGLTVWKEIVQLLPTVSTIYIADSAHAPYGSKSPEQIYILAKKLIRFLLEKDVDIIVIACNAITTNCLEQLRQDFSDTLIVGTVPAIKVAGEVSQTKHIGVFSTTATAKSPYQMKLIDEFAQDCDVVNVGTDELVPLIEQGITKGSEVRKVLERTLNHFQEEPVDVVVLGCTHYPLITSEIGAILGNRVQIIDSGGAIARQVQRLVERIEQRKDKSRLVRYTFFTTGHPNLAQSILESVQADLPLKKERKNFVKITL